MKQIVITLKKVNILTYLTLFDNRPESFTPLSETRLRDKKLRDPGYTAKKYTILKKRNSRGTFCNYKRKTCKWSKSLVSLIYPLVRPWKHNTKKKVPQETMKWWALINFGFPQTPTYRF